MNERAIDLAFCDRSLELSRGAGGGKDVLRRADEVCLSVFARIGPSLNAVATLMEESALAGGAARRRGAEVRHPAAAAARHPVCREGSARHERRGDDVGLAPLQGSSSGGRRDRDLAARRGRRGPRRQARDGRARGRRGVPVRVRLCCRGPGRTRGTRNTGRAALPAARVPPWRPASCPLRSARRRGAPSCARPATAASRA